MSDVDSPLGEVVTVAWMAQGECRRVDPDLFFPERGHDARQAKAVCFGCPVREQCLEYALDNNEKFGIWGGLSERERRRIRSQRSRDRSALFAGLVDAVDDALHGGAVA